MKFAPLIRVSTEEQQEKGDSLALQKSQIVQAVTILGGTVPDYCWQYSGQESATTSEERLRFDKLLEDAPKGLFDAVMVADESRWSRENLKSETGLDILKKAGIKFFVLVREIDLFDHNQAFILRMLVNIHSYSAAQNAVKSILGRIHLAKKGVPTGGRIPHARTYDKKARTWAIDQEKYDKVKYAVERFLKGDNREEIAKAIGMNHSHLYYVLRNHLGDTYPFTIESKKYGIPKTTVSIPVPPLFGPDIIRKVHAQLDANKTYHHGQTKHRYLLARMVHCGHCGWALYGETVKGKHQYYTHTSKKDYQCDNYMRIPVNLLDDAVMRDVFQMIGDPSIRERAVRDANPNIEESKRLEKEIEVHDKELKRIRTRKDNLLNAVAEGLLPANEIKSKMDDLMKREGAIIGEIAKTRAKVEGMLTEQDIKRAVSDLGKRILADISYSPFVLDKMSWERKREILETVFGGRDADGKRFGVYLSKTDGQWAYILKGIFPEVTKTLNLKEEEDLLCNYKKDLVIPFIVNGKI